MTKSEICSKLTIKTPERRQCRRFGVFTVNFLTYFTPCSSVSIVNFEHVIAGWDIYEVKSSDINDIRKLRISTLS